MKLSRSHIFISLLFSLFSISAIAQSKADEGLDFAINVYNAGKVAEAKNLIGVLMKKYPGYDRGYFVKAQWDLQDKNFDDALKNLNQLQAINPKFNPLMYRMMAEANIGLRKFSDAQENLNNYFNNFSLSEQGKLEGEKLQKDIDFASTAPTENYKVVYTDIGPEINTLNGEYFPSTTADEQVLYFTRKTNENEDIWISQKKDNKWQPAVMIDQPKMKNDKTYSSINSDENDGAHTIAPSGKFLFFTSCDRPGGAGSCDIYFSKLDGDKWGEPKILPPPINTKSWESQPCISADGKYLFFASGRPNGKGASDLYVSEITAGGKFSEPKNLGDNINTSGSEDRPFIHPDGKTLYFSSSGHPGYGGRDLYVSKLVNGEWSKPTNLGSQINSADDELSIFVNTLGNKAYVAKHNVKNGKADYDIFTFDLPAQYQPEKTTYIRGIVVDATNNKPIVAKVKLFEPESNQDIMSMTSDKENGTFLMTLVSDKNYGFNVIAKGYSVFSQQYSFKTDGSGKPQDVVIKLTPLTKGTIFTLKNVFFETGKYDLKPSSTQELDNLVNILKESPEIRIQISGHTDNVGKETDNQVLSENRAKSVMNYLVSKGIDPSRLVAKGYGATKPVAKNDTPEGRAQNRRTEIEII